MREHDRADVAISAGGAEVIGELGDEPARERVAVVW